MVDISKKAEQPQTPKKVVLQTATSSTGSETSTSSASESSYSRSPSPVRTLNAGPSPLRNTLAISNRNISTEKKPIEHKTINDFPPSVRPNLIRDDATAVQSAAQTSKAIVPNLTNVAEKAQPEESSQNAPKDSDSREIYKSESLSQKLETKTIQAAQPKSIVSAPVVRSVQVIEKAAELINEDDDNSFDISDISDEEFVVF